MTRKRLGEILLAEGIITNEQLEEALAEQKTSSQLLGEILVAKNFISEKDIAETLSTQFSFPYVSAEQYFISQDIGRTVPIELMKKYLFVPLDKFNNILVIAVAGSVEKEMFEEIEEAAGCDIQVVVSTLSEVKNAIEKLARQFKAADTPDEAK